MARLEARVAFEVLLPRLHHLELREEKIRWAESLVFRGPTRMRIAFEATR